MKLKGSSYDASFTIIIFNSKNKVQYFYIDSIKFGDSFKFNDIKTLVLTNR